MKLRSLVFLGLVSGLALTGCGDDDDGGGSGGTGGGGTGGASTGGMGGMGAMGGMGGMAGMGTGGMAGMGTGGMAGMGTGGMAGMGMGGAGTGGSGTGGAGTGGAGTGGAGTGGTGGGGNLTPDAFCASYETHCTFTGTDHFKSSAECKTKYTAMGPLQQKCTNEHLAMAATTTSIHCTHATGIAPCNQTN